MRRLSIIVLLLAACSSAPPPPPPSFTSVPTSAIEAMCMRIHDEGIARETMVNVMATTRPLVTEQSLQALMEAAFYQGRIDRRAVEDAYASNKNALKVPSSATCAFNAVDPRAHRSGDTMTLELSSPFIAPMSKGGPGMLARLSLGGESATWYWIPLKNQNGSWTAGTAMPLGMHE